MVIDAHALKAYKANSESSSETHLLDVIVGRDPRVRKNPRDPKKFTEVLSERLQNAKLK